VKVGADAEAALMDVLTTFCTAFEQHDGDRVLRLLAPDPDTTVVTSEDALLRGPDEFRAFMDRYVDGPTTYSWSWDHVQASSAGSIAWLLATGTETAETAGQRVDHSYRMTMVLERRDEQWLVLQVHGSSPH
jgi:uncharacterized protein (TIGR02246 family)